MKRIIALLLIFCCIGITSYAQLSVEPYVGYQADLNNHGNGFKQLNTGLQLAWAATKRYELVFQLQRSWPVTKKGTDSIFTTNPSLPLSAVTQSNIDASSWSFAIGQRFKLTAVDADNILYAVVNVGGVYQKIQVKHAYDKANYTILNPDQTRERIGPYVSGGFLYMRKIAGGGVFAQLMISSPPVGKKISSYSTYNFIAPLSLNLGYSIWVSKK